MKFDVDDDDLQLGFDTNHRFVGVNKLASDTSFDDARKLLNFHACDRSQIDITSDQSINAHCMPEIMRTINQNKRNERKDHIAAPSDMTMNIRSGSMFSGSNPPIALGVHRSGSTDSEERMKLKRYALVTFECAERRIDDFVFHNNKLFEQHLDSKPTRHCMKCEVTRNLLTSTKHDCNADYLVAASMAMEEIERQMQLNECSPLNDSTQLIANCPGIWMKTPGTTNGLHWISKSTGETINYPAKKGFGDISETGQSTFDSLIFGGEQCTVSIPARGKPKSPTFYRAA